MLLSLVRALAILCRVLGSRVRGRGWCVRRRGVAGTLLCRLCWPMLRRRVHSDHTCHEYPRCLPRPRHRHLLIILRAFACTCLMGARRNGDAAVRIMLQVCLLLVPQQRSVHSGHHLLSCAALLCPWCAWPLHSLTHAPLVMLIALSRAAVSHSCHHQAAGTVGQLCLFVLRRRMLGGHSLFTNLEYRPRPRHVLLFFALIAIIALPVVARGSHG